MENIDERIKKYLNEKIISINFLNKISGKYYFESNGNGINVYYKNLKKGKEVIGQFSSFDEMIETGLDH